MCDKWNIHIDEVSEFLTSVKVVIRNWSGCRCPSWRAPLFTSAISRLDMNRYLCTEDKWSLLHLNSGTWKLVKSLSFCSLGSHRVSLSFPFTIGALFWQNGSWEDWICNMIQGTEMKKFKTINTCTFQCFYCFLFVCFLSYWSLKSTNSTGRRSFLNEATIPGPLLPDTSSQGQSQEVFTFHWGMDASLAYSYRLYCETFGREFY